MAHTKKMSKREERRTVRGSMMARWFTKVKAAVSSGVAPRNSTTRECLFRTLNAEIIMNKMVYDNLTV